MSNTLLILGGAALVGGAYYCYRRRKSQKPVSKEKLINNLVDKLDAEVVDRLTLSDVTNYFKSLQLKKGRDLPIIAKAVKNGINSYLLVTFNEETNDIINYKLISPKSIDDELMKILENETLVVLS